MFGQSKRDKVVSSPLRPEAVMEKKAAENTGLTFAFGVPRISSTSAKPAFLLGAASTNAPHTVKGTKDTKEDATIKPLQPPKLEEQWRDVTEESSLVTARNVTDKDEGTSLTNRNEGATIDIPVFSALQPKLEEQWRDVKWTEEQKESLMKTVISYRPNCEEVTKARVLLLGPVSSGKSSFISSVQSVFNGRVTNRAMVGSFSTSFTKKLQSFSIHARRGEENTGLELCDIMGLGDGEMTGLTLHDILSVIKGHVPEGHRFSPDKPVTSETVGFVKMPSLEDKIHCVAFVVDASKILTYPKGLSTTFKQLREHISELGVHQVALLTHVDQICPETAKDVTKVYKSRYIREMVNKSAALLGMSPSYIIPVKNYSSELDLDVNMDVLLLSAVDHILQYADLFFQDHKPRQTKTKMR